MRGIENCPGMRGRGRDLLLRFPNFHPAVSNLKQTLMEQWSLVQNQPLLEIIYLKPPMISYKGGRSLKRDTIKSLTLRLSFCPSPRLFPGWGWGQEFSLTGAFH